MRAISAILLSLAFALPAVGQSSKDTYTRARIPPTQQDAARRDPVLSYVEANVAETLYHELAHALIDASMDGIMVTDERGIIQSVNPAFSVLTGYSEREALGQNASLIGSGKQSPQFYKEMWSHLRQNGTWQGEIWTRHRSGRDYLEWLTINVLHDAQGNATNYIGTFSDI